MTKNFFSHHQKKDDSGFTLIETVLYFAIAATLVVVIAATTALALTARVKSQAIAEVDDAGAAATQLLTQAVRSSVSLDSPTAGLSASTLSFTTASAALNPTVVSISNGVLKITEGTSPATDLTGNTVTVSNLTFTNLSRPNTPGSVRISFVVTRNNPNNRKEFQYSQTFYGTATLRQP